MFVETCRPMKLSVMLFQHTVLLEEKRELNCVIRDVVVVNSVGKRLLDDDAIDVVCYVVVGYGVVVGVFVEVNTHLIFGNVVLCYGAVFGVGKQNALPIVRQIQAFDGYVATVYESQVACITRGICVSSVRPVVDGFAINSV